jgi:hypothetical protein
MSEAQKYITWTIPLREQLRKAYKLAIEHKRESFIFDGNEFVTSYAKYLLEHLDNQLGPK